MWPLPFCRIAAVYPTSPLWLPDLNPRQGLCAEGEPGFIPFGRCQRLAAGGCLALRPGAGAEVMTATMNHGTLRILPGSQFPLGATPSALGTNFAVTSGVADAVTLCLFDDAG